MKRQTRTCFTLLLISFLLVGCGPNAKTPGGAFKIFSKWLSMAQPELMEKYGDKTYVLRLLNYFDSLALLSEVWPKDPLIISSEEKGNEATIKVAGKNVLGKEVTGTFFLKKDGDHWIVYDGTWEDLLGKPPLTEDTPDTESTSETDEPAPAVEEQH